MGKTVTMTGAAILLAGGLALGAAKLDASGAREAKVLERTPVALSPADAPSAVPEDEASGFIIIPTMSFDTRVTDYSNLADIEPGLPIKDYFDDFFPYNCVDLGDGSKDWISTRIFRGNIKLHAYAACRAQVVTICQPFDDEHPAAKRLISANQGILFRLSEGEGIQRCGMVTTAHGWKSLISDKATEYPGSALCVTVQRPAGESLSRLEKIGRLPNGNIQLAGSLSWTNDTNYADALSALEFDAPAGDYHQEHFDVARIDLIYDAMISGLFGTTGALSTDLEFESLSRRHCGKLDHDASNVRLDQRLPSFADIRALTSVSALRSTCDLGVMICASPPNGQASDQKRCSHYLPEELGAEGDVYDFRSLVNGKGTIRHYGTSFKGLSGAGHYCLRKDYEPIPFGMSVAVKSNPANADRETYNKWLALYIMQGSRERGEYVIVQHLANLADFEDFREHHGLD